MLPGEEEDTIRRNFVHQFVQAMVQDKLCVRMATPATVGFNLAVLQLRVKQYHPVPAPIGRLKSGARSGGMLMTRLFLREKFPLLLVSTMSLVCCYSTQKYLVLSMW